MICLLIFVLFYCFCIQLLRRVYSFKADRRRAAFKIIEASSNLTKDMKFRVWEPIVRETGCPEFVVKITTTSFAGVFYVFRFHFKRSTFHLHFRCIKQHLVSNKISSNHIEKLWHYDLLMYCSTIWFLLIWQVIKTVKTHCTDSQIVSVEILSW